MAEHSTVVGWVVAAETASAAVAASISMASVLGGSGAPIEREGENEALCLYRLGQGRTRGTWGEDARAVRADAFRAQI
jgi:hypothetical protein